MSRTIAAERKLLGEDGFALVAPSHHPAIGALDAAALAALEAALTAEHERIQALVRDRRRAVRGRDVPPGAGPAPAEPDLTAKKQSYAAALKRVGREKLRRAGG